ncbi:NADH-quinone oxidoreductase subunit J [bacterium]|nr:NADH-quinone oxidoreductase subunit J [bacterium]
MATPVVIFFSYLLVAGLLVGVSSLILLAIARFRPYRRFLATLAVLGFVAFVWGMCALTQPGYRLLVCYFWLFTAAVVGGGVGCVTMRNVFHAALMLILSLLGVAGYFILVNAEFLAMVQVIIYIGGIMVLFLFGIMVSQNIIGTQLKQNTPQSPWAAICAGVLFMVMFFTGLFMTLKPTLTVTPDVLGNNTGSVGWSLMATYALPFEVASVLLLMAMLGAIILVRKD